MKNKILFTSFTAALFLIALRVNSQIPVPRPDHVVVLIMENHSYEDIIGNTQAPFINQLAQENALMTASYALTHPSQPNYLMLFSGSAQGVTNDNAPAGIPWSAPNLGAELLQSGLTFKAYSDGLPSTGFTGSTSGAYRSKHAPWTNWQGSTSNGISSGKHRPFTDFPTNFSLLPTVSFVVPDQNHDMHDGTIADGDAWVSANLSAYITWAKTNNSLFILTFDEDGGDNLNHIVTLFAGQMVQPGNYNTSCNHYDLLRTVEDMYGLGYAGGSATATTITSVWIPESSTSTADIKKNVSVLISPNPVSTTARIDVMGITNPGACAFMLFDMLGNEVKNLSAAWDTEQHSFILTREGIKSGVYFYRLANTKETVYTGRVVIE